MIVATVLTVYGIETMNPIIPTIMIMRVATVLTVYGIETQAQNHTIQTQTIGCNSTYRLRY